MRSVSIRIASRAAVVRSLMRHRTFLCGASPLAQIQSHRRGMSRGMSSTTSNDTKVQLNDTDDVPVIDMAPFIHDPSSKASQAECAKCAESLKRFGVVVLRDPRVTEAHNNSFLDTMEAYFNQPHELKIADTRPELHYQVGAWWPVSLPLSGALLLSRTRIGIIGRRWELRQVRSRSRCARLTSPASNLLITSLPKTNHIQSRALIPSGGFSGA